MSQLETTKAEIRRQYDEVIAPNYDLDPQLVTSRTFARVLDQLEQEARLSAELPPLKVLDVGMGTGAFLARLRDSTDRAIRPFGIDLSEKMIDVAKVRVPDLTASIDDAANLDLNFAGESFELICTHFVTGFVPMDHLAPRIWKKLKPGGYWSFAGATSEAFPHLQRTANNRVLRLFVGGGRTFSADDLLTPVDCDAVVKCFTKHGFETCTAETFKPNLNFGTFDDFMEFAYRGSWLTPFIEAMGLQHARPLLKRMLNAMFFPMHDHHCIAVGTARRPLE